MRYYDSKEEVVRRLANCVIFYKGEPVRVLDGCQIKSKKSRFGVIIRDMPTAERSWKIPLDDPDLNYKNFRLGLVNYKNSVYRLERIPMRTVRQGLNTENCVFRNVINPDYDNLPFDRVWSDPDIVASVAGKFPSLEEAEKKCREDKVTAKAFHYDWFWQQNMGVPVLWYKTRPVGLTIDPKVILKLEPKLHYLKDSLREIGIRVAN